MLYERYIKRCLDIVLSLMTIILLSPVYGLVAILVKVKMGSPIVFSQERPGKFGKIFRMYKFRTMTSQRDENGELLPDEQRLTNFGKFLRSSSLDELPELINILKGDMSIVGPRPLLVQYLSRYSQEQQHRHDVRPGLTGLAQVNGRNAISWEEKFAYDLEYVHNISFRLDARIIFMTIKKVLQREGISQSGEATMQEFMGTESLKEEERE